jgi:hypothetical protein
LWAKTVETCRSARRDAGARAADIAAIGMASTIGRMARRTPNSASSSARSACGQSDCMAARRSAVWKQTRRGFACQKTTGANVMFCQPYNVVTRWRSVSLGLYSCNGAALRIVSAYR